VHSRADLSRTAAIVVTLPLTARRFAVAFAVAFAVPWARSIDRRVRPVRSVVDIKGLQLKGLQHGAAAAEMIQPIREGE
jgi:hypothetical protein